jgi:hypothetical protein
MDISTLKELIVEELSEKDIVQAECLIHTKRDANITDILTNIRALPGVTIVSMLGSSKQVSLYKEISRIRIKFLPLTGSVKEYIIFLNKKVRTFPTVFSFKVLDYAKEDLIRKNNS